MTSSRRRPAGSSENGFTLIELLVVTLIIGVLAAIALPLFLGHRAKSEDAKAKTNARNLASHVEACFVLDSTYVGCSAEITEANSQLDLGAGPGQVRISLETPTGYAITATSRAETAGSRHTFTLVHNVGGVFDRTCAPVGEGGCSANGDW